MRLMVWVRNSASAASLNAMSLHCVRLRLTSVGMTRDCSAAPHSGRDDNFEVVTAQNQNHPDVPPEPSNRLRRCYEVSLPFPRKQGSLAGILCPFLGFAPLKAAGRGEPWIGQLVCRCYASSAARPENVSGVIDLFFQRRQAHRGNWRLGVE